MDLRYSNRYDADLKITVYHRGHRLLRCDAGNISHTGMFLKTRTIFFPKHTPLEIRFAVDLRNMKQIIYTRAQVVHNTHNGIGIEFIDNRGECLAQAQ